METFWLYYRYIIKYKLKVIDIGIQVDKHSGIEFSCQLNCKKIFNDNFYYKKIKVCITDIYIST